jgi:hypothetical protein
MAQYGNEPDPTQITVDVKWDIMAPTSTLGEGANVSDDHNFDTPTQGPHSLGPTSAGLNAGGPAGETDGQVATGSGRTPGFNP